MAALLNITPRTIEFHLSHIYRKLMVTSRTEAVLKLSEQRPRESAGLEQQDVNQGKSTVAKTAKRAKNRGRPVQSWSLKMPYPLYGLLAVILLFAIFLGAEKLTQGASGHLVTVGQSRATTSFALATSTSQSSPTPISTSTASPTASSLPTGTATAVPITPSPGANGNVCNGPMPAMPAGPKGNVVLVNATKASVTVSLYLAENKFGECGYSSYTLPWGASIPLNGVLPYGCYYTYAIINDPRAPTHVTSGPDCINEPDKLIFTVTYTRIKISLGP